MFGIRRSRTLLRLLSLTKHCRGLFNCHSERIRSEVEESLTL